MIRYIQIEDSKKIDAEITFKSIKNYSRDVKLRRFPSSKNVYK